MNLRDLRYLVALADLHHFGKAADACHVSQPTLSAQLKKLESHLGVQLVERSQRQVILTEIGEEIADRARGILNEVDEIVETARRYQDPFSGSLRIGFIPTLGPYLLPHIIPAITERYANLELLLYEDLTYRLLARLREGDLDAAIMALPVDTDGLEETYLFTEPFVVALPKDHPLVKKETLHVDDLNGNTLLLLEDGHCLRDQALEVCSHVNTPERRDFRATSLETLRHMVGAGSGVTLLPKLAVTGQVPKHPSVVVRPFADPIPCRKLGILWRKRSARQKAIAGVRAVIQERMTGVMHLADMATLDAGSL